MAAEKLFCSPACRSAAKEPVSDAIGCECDHVECLGRAGESGPEALQRGAPERLEAGEL
jgi:hypothetical protein